MGGNVRPTVWSWANFDKGVLVGENQRRLCSEREKEEPKEDQQRYGGMIDSRDQTGQFEERTEGIQDLHVPVVLRHERVNKGIVD